MAPEATTSRWSAAQRERLAALGFEVYVPRAPPVDCTGSPTPPSRVASGSVASVTAASRSPGPGGALPDVGLRLVVLGASARDGALFDALRVALGLSRDAIAGSALPGLPILAFGIEAGAPDALLAPPIAQLRDAAAKRALWPALRRLRRRLREVDSAGS